MRVCTICSRKGDATVCWLIATQTEPSRAEPSRAWAWAWGLAIVDGIAQRWQLPLQLDWNDAQQTPGRKGLLAQLQLPAVFTSKI